MSRSALIFGVSGQDGAYLSRLLLEKGYVVHGVSRDASQPFWRLEALGLRARVAVHTASPENEEQIGRLLEATEPDEIYNFTGLTSVAQSFASPELAIESIVGTQRRLLEAIRQTGSQARLYQSASTDCFGDLPHGTAADETTPFAPRSPYAAAKAEAFRTTRVFREHYGLFAVSGIVGNHESPLRGEQFVTRKIIHAACAAARDEEKATLHLGNVTAWRDWGYAPEYVEAMWRMLQQETPEDFVIATGESHSVEEFVAAAYAAFGLDHREHVVIDPDLFRPADIQYSRGNPERARERLGWEAKTKFAELVRLLAEAAVTATITRQNPCVA